jgi:hypothetical protein
VFLVSRVWDVIEEAVQFVRPGDGPIQSHADACVDVIAPMYDKLGTDRLARRI